MKKTISPLFILSLFIFSFVISSCGGGDEAGTEHKIDTKDVKGALKADGASVSMTNLHNGDGEFEVPFVKFEGAGFMIVPTARTFEEEWALAESNLTGFGSYEMIEKKEAAAFYKVTKEFMEKKTEGYSFIVWVKGDKTNYIMKGESPNIVDPIADKEVAEKAFNAAMTFKPE